MDALFYELLDNGLSEVARREACYLQRFPLAFPPVERRVERYRSMALYESHPAEQIEQVTAETISYLAAQGMEIAEQNSEADAVALTLLDAGMDAFAAMRGDLALQPAKRPIPSIVDVLATDYEEKHTGGGRRYFVRRQGSRPLLLINALGIPLTVWTQFLSDSSHDFQIILVESRCSDLATGGMQSDADLAVHADDIAAVLEAEQPGATDVLAWCNGGRIAIDLLCRYAHPVRSLVLLSTTMRGVGGLPSYPSPFEDNLQEVFRTVLGNQGMAEPLAKMLRRYAKAPDWNALESDPVARAVALFRLPAQESSAALLSPMANGQFLLNYARRTAADEAYPIDAALAHLAARGLPVLLVTGDQDHVVSNDAICAVLRKFVGKAVHANVSGAGHYVHDLQYPYFRWLLRSFSATATLPGNTARVATQEMAA